MLSILPGIKNWYLDLPIVRKLNVSYLVIILVPIMLLSLLANKVSSDTIIKQTIHNSAQNLNVVTESLDRMLEFAVNLSGIIVTDDNIQAVSKAPSLAEARIFEYEHVIRSDLDTIIQPRNIVSSVVIYLDKGNVFATTNIDTNKIEFHPANAREYVKLFEENWGEAIYYDTHRISYKIGQKGNYVTLLRPVISVANSDIVGRAELNISEANISGIYSKIKYGQTGRFFIANYNGTIVSSSVKDEIYDSIENQDYFKWALESSKSGEIFKIEGKKYLITSQRYDDMKWVIMGMIPLSELVGENRKVSNLIYLFGVICIMLSLPFLMLFSNTISKPVVNLSEKMVLAGQGDLEVRVDVASSDEIGFLSKSFNKMVGQVSDLMDQIYTEQRNKRRYELFALQAQIKPHFLYNTLESICSLVQLKRLDDTFKMVKSLAMFYRTSLSRGKNIITLREELENVKNYLTIQKLRYEDKLKYCIDLNEDILDEKIIKLTLQPLVENSIYHGFRKTGKRGTIEIKGEREEKFIKIYVKDDGKGFDKESWNILAEDEQNACNEGFGLRSVNDRLKLHFGPEYGIRIIESNEKGAAIEILLPCSNDLDGVFEI